MDTLLTIANWLLPLMYLALAIDYGATFILRIRTHVRNPAVALTVVLHALVLVMLGVRFGGLPLANNYEILSVIALSSAAVYWAIERATHARRAGVFVFLLIFLMQHTSSVFLTGSLTGTSASHSSAAYGWGRLHALPASLAYTALAFAAVYALLYLMGHRNLKQHRFGLLFDRLPPLELLGRMSWYALLGGFVLMSAAIVTGVILSGRADRAALPALLRTKLAAKIVIGTIAWCVCAVAILGKYLGGWSVSRVSRIAVAGFVIIVLLFVTSLVLS